MSTGRSAAKREAKQQRKLLAEQQRETQKLLAEEKDIESRQRRSMTQAQQGRDSVLQQQLGIKSLLGASMARDGSGGGAGGVVTGGSGYFIPATSPGAPLYKARSPSLIVKSGMLNSGGGKSGSTLVSRLS